ncbi:MAG: DNA alkylation repair protein [Chloroflexi bacterium]|nr:DNA alkylation repair protein [Chloroflexota bacterium]MCC6894827.1 DNA alkylation repair protein [Anaerolineae bacterium]
MPIDLTAKQFIQQLERLQSPDELKKIHRYFKSGKGESGKGDIFIGVKIGQVFTLAKPFIDLPPDEIEKLLD